MRNWFVWPILVSVFVLVLAWIVIQAPGFALPHSDGRAWAAEGAQEPQADGRAWVVGGAQEPQANTRSLEDDAGDSGDDVQNLGGNDLDLDGNEILARVDENIGSRNKHIEASMIIQGRRGTRTVKSRSWIRGTDESFTEYLDPPRERGTKMLKLEDQLWTYSPATDRTIRISGHMLRQSVMGSDLSYEDLMEDPKLHDFYDAAVTGVDTCLERSCWVLELTARSADIAYYTRRVWVDQERFLLLKENRYAKSGTLLKTTHVRSVDRIDGRWVATRVVFRDALKSGDGTQFVLDNMQFDVDIPPQLFSKASLRR
jgi:outer membrane lipoprotein-sorting protein